MSHLLSKPNIQNPQGRIQNITPENANWSYVGFDVFKLNKGQKVELSTSSNEVCLTIISGLATISTSKEKWENIGERLSPFEQKAPYSVYVPPHDNFVIEALSDNFEVAICKAPAEGKFPARLITPSNCEYETRGTGTNLRHVCNILFGNFAAESLLVCEVITPGGNWSSYPPHKHDRDLSPEETQLEETYYHRINPPQGFAFQRVYNDDRSLDETMAVEDSCVVKVPEGYHPVGAPHGYDLYYLNVMAGPKREWVFKNDPNHEWMLEKK